MKGSAHFVPDGFPGNIARPHGRNFQILLFIEWNTGKTKEVKKWIFSLLDSLTFHARQLEQSSSKDRCRTQTFRSLLLTYRGYEQLELPFTKLTNGNTDFIRSFMNGSNSKKMWVYQWDTGFEGGNIEEEFKPAGGEVVNSDCALLLANDDLGVLDDEVYRIRKELGDIGILAKSHVQTSVRSLSNSFGEDVMVGPLGFRDGISNVNDPFSIYHMCRKEDFRDEKDYSVGFGAYAVFQKIRVNRQVFYEDIKKLAEEIGPVVHEKYDALAWAEAIVMGRFKDGSPIVAVSNTDLQNFHYESNISQGSVACPVFAHVRAANPRQEKLIPGTTTKIREVEIIRRGMPFYEQNKGDVQVGLHFMSYQREIGKLLEVMNNMSDNDDVIAYRLGGRVPKVETIPNIPGRKKKSPITFKFRAYQYTTLLGAEAFFAPSKPYLINALRESSSESE